MRSVPYLLSTSIRKYFPNVPILKALPPMMGNFDDAVHYYLGHRNEVGGIEVSLDLTTKSIYSDEASFWLEALILVGIWESTFLDGRSFEKKKYYAGFYDSSPRDIRIEKIKYANEKIESTIAEMKNTLGIEKISGEEKRFGADTLTKLKL